MATPAIPWIRRPIKRAGTAVVSIDWGAFEEGHTRGSQAKQECTDKTSSQTDQERGFSGWAFSRKVRDDRGEDKSRKPVQTEQRCGYILGLGWVDLQTVLNHVA